eukprot:1181024-Pyramimonas_sp.AAC.1
MSLAVVIVTIVNTIVNSIVVVTVSDVIIRPSLPEPPTRIDSPARQRGLRHSLQCCPLPSLSAIAAASA